MKTTYLLLTTALLATFWSSAIASTVCPDCSQHAEGATLRDPVSCSHYYKCVNGRAQRKNCGSGFYFDERFLICNFAAFVDCKALTEPETTTCEPPKHLPCLTTTPVPDPEHCVKTTTCAPHKKTPSPADDHHHHHDHDHEHCVKTTTCAPHKKTPAPADDPEHCDTNSNRHNHVNLDFLQHRSDCKSLSDNTVLLDPHHCSRYYVCRHGRAKPKKCSAGQWYDGHRMACRNQADVSNCAVNRN